MAVVTTPYHPIASMLAATVPLIIAELQALGGPTDSDFDEARTLAPDLAAHGDVMLYGGGRPGQAGELANRLARGIAVLSFVPGGITVFGCHWEVEVPADDRVPSTYYSPSRVLAIIEPERWSGMYLAEAADELAGRRA